MTVEAPKSRYRQVADQLRQDITHGEYPPGSTLPSEAELADKMGVSRVTINRAVQILRAEGLVRVLRGRGTVVRSVPPISRHSNQRYARAIREERGARGAFDAEIRRLGLEPRSDIVQLEPVNPPEAVAKALGLGQRERVLIRKRHMYASDEPVLLATSYIPWALAERAGLTKVDTGPGGTYSRLAELGQGPVRFTEDVRARIPTDDEEAFFGLAENQQVFEIVHMSWTATDRLVEYRVDALPTFQWVLHFEWPAEAVESGSRP
ncbi:MULTISPECIES: GntR family transcriptional regulator [Protofrankia]|uniref:Transcriptional regulator, GntR family with UTRA sensor domain n=1 Tax=Candidatus Protofrankia datiscae TaxID=2716812 RepID=F8B0C6_9ACTN|nr:MULTISPECIES: GntR family transcriptional regulator [Protofrankia]AEH08752.1 transcriptional regulator, GntR family with UTRA sensor domain [Candidatus Protofrankia datiscae]